MSHIVEILRKRQLKALRLSQAMSEAKENHVSDKGRHVRTMLGGEDPDMVMSQEAHVLKTLYYEMMRSYTGKFPAFAKSISPRSVALWERVAAANKAANCTPERFMKAQFAWFDKNFGTTPKKHQLTTESAVERAQEFTGKTTGRVVGAKKAPVSKAESFRESEKLLQKMMIAQKCSREEFYREFVLTGIYIFPQEFLKADPVYQKVASG